MDPALDIYREWLQDESIRQSIATAWNGVVDSSASDTFDDGDLVPKVRYEQSWRLQLADDPPQDHDIAFLQWSMGCKENNLLRLPLVFSH